MSWYDTYVSGLQLYQLHLSGGSPRENENLLA